MAQIQARPARLAFIEMHSQHNAAAFFVFSSFRNLVLVVTQWESREGDATQAQRRRDAAAKVNPARGGFGCLKGTRG
jgi:hypothetical protein